METIKSYTDIKQSKKLAEFLPLESADMKWIFSPHHDKHFPLLNGSIFKIGNDPRDLPCWSLAALLSVLPYPEIWQDHSTNRWACSSLIKDTEYLWESENPVDSCVEVIIKFHKEGLL